MDAEAASRSLAARACTSQRSRLGAPTGTYPVSTAFLAPQAE
jgi:hypothetical protein